MFNTVSHCIQGMLCLIAANCVDSELICSISADQTFVRQCSLVSAIVLFTYCADVKNVNIFTDLLLLDVIKLGTSQSCWDCMYMLLVSFQFIISLLEWHHVSRR